MNPNFSQNYNRLARLGRVSKAFGGQTMWENFHPGVDIENKEGTPIPAMSSGVVTGVVTGQPKENPYAGYGNQVAIKTDRGDTEYYSHLKGAYVKRGQRVHSGDTIAPMGSSGSAYNPNGGSASHLDLRIVDAYGKYKNPTNLVKQYV